MNFEYSLIVIMILNNFKIWKKRQKILDKQGDKVLMVMGNRRMI